MQNAFGIIVRNTPETVGILVCCHLKTMERLDAVVYIPATSHCNQIPMVLCNACMCPYRPAMPLLGGIVVSGRRSDVYYLYE